MLLLQTLFPQRQDPPRRRPPERETGQGEDPQQGGGRQQGAGGQEVPPDHARSCRFRQRMGMVADDQHQMFELR